MAPMVPPERIRFLLSEIAREVDAENYLFAADDAAELIALLLQQLSEKYKGVT